MSTADLESTVRQVLAMLQTGVRLDWTDLHVYVIVLVASFIGAVAASWFLGFFSKRGELTAVKKDLEQITSTTEYIRSKVSTAAWVQQNVWTLKKETYWKLTSVLSEHDVPVTDTEEVLQVLAGQCEGACRSKYDGFFNTYLKAGVDLSAELTPVSLLKISEKALEEARRSGDANSIRALEMAVAEVYLSMAEDMAVWEDLIEGSFKGIIQDRLDHAVSV